jgi:hypothetical protein
MYTIKQIFVLVLLVLISQTSVKADEGMWLPLFIKRLNEVDMQKKGLKLTAEEIYSVNQSSLKDAIVNFGDFCTGEVISKEGLVLTNHHRKRLFNKWFLGCNQRRRKAYAGIDGNVFNSDGRCDRKCIGCT